MEMPKPGDAHRKLERLVGTWSGEDCMHPSPWCPEGATAGGRLACRVALGGFAVVSDYQQERDGRVTFSGHGVHRWDAHHQRYMLHWFDSMGLNPSVFTGELQRGVLTLICRDGPQLSRARYDFTEDGVLHHEMAMSADGATWTVWMDGTYRRQD